MNPLILLLASALTFSALAKAEQYWVCVDAQGHKSAQDHPCPEPKHSEESTVLVPGADAPPELDGTPKKVKFIAPKVDLGSVIGLLLLATLIAAVPVAIKLWIAGLAKKRLVDKVLKTAGDFYERIEPSSELRSQVSEPTAPPPRPNVWTLQLIRSLEWKRFEELCAGYWRARGYRALLTKVGADGGVDIELYAPTDERRLMAIAQCKSWTEAVGVKEVREFWGVANHLSAKLALFYCLSGFSDDAKAFAVGKNYRLFTGQDLLDQVLQLPQSQQTELLVSVARDDYITPTCSQCDVKMTLRKNRDGKTFWGCVNFPRCGQTLGVRVGV